MEAPFSPVETALGGLLEDFARAHHIPGLSFGLVSEGAPLWFKGVGLADRAAERRVTARTRFRIASMTKNTTALAILMLRDAGKVALDAPVGTYVPELADWPLPTRDSRAVTLRDLLTHSAGLVTDDPWGDRQLGIAPQVFSRLLAGGNLFAQAPGMAFEYSNLGYAMLGRVITNVARQRYQDYIASALFRPLGMADTTFDFEAAPAAQRAIGYRWAAERWSPEAAEADGEFGAMGGMVTTADDYARYVAILLSAWPPRDVAESGPVKRATIRELGLSHGFPLPAATRDAGGKTITVSGVYGYGMVHSLDPILGRTLHHRGGLPGYGSHFLVSPDTGIGIFSFANVTYAEMDRLNVGAAQILHDAGLWQRRPRRLSKALKDAVALAMRFYVDGHVTESELLSDNLLLDTPAVERNDAIAALKQRLGDGTLARIEPQHDLAGRFFAACANGMLAGTVILTPGPRPRIQTLRFDAQA